MKLFIVSPIQTVSSNLKCLFGSKIWRLAIHIVAHESDFCPDLQRHLMPIARINPTRIGEGKPELITREVMRMFGEYTEKKKL